MSETVNVDIKIGFPDKEQAGLIHSGLMAAIELLAKFGINPEATMNAYPEFFNSAIEELAQKEGISIEESRTFAIGSLGRLFEVIQDMCYINATEIGEAIGERVPSDDLLLRKINAGKVLNRMTEEEVMQEVKNILSSGKEYNQ